MGRKPLAEDEPSKSFAIKLPSSWVDKIHRLKMQAKVREAIKNVLKEEQEKDA